MSQNDVISSIKSDLRSQVKRLEKLRKTYMAWLVVGIGLASFSVTFLLLFINPQGIDMRYTVTFGALVPSALIYLLLNRTYMKKATRQYIESLCAASGFRSREDGCFGIGVTNKHKILPDHNKAILETGMQGNYKDTPLAIQEAVLTELKQDPKHKQRKKEFLRFWGLLVRIELKRSVDGHTVVIPRVALNTFFKQDFSKYSVIKPASNNRFEKTYDVLATDTVEAKLIVKSSFKDSFIAAAKTLNVYWAEASFNGSEILLAFQRFRPFISITPLWKPVTERNLRKNADEIESITKIIDALKSNSQISV